MLLLPVPVSPTPAARAHTTIASSFGLNERPLYVPPVLSTLTALEELEVVGWTLEHVGPLRTRTGLRRLSIDSAQTRYLHSAIFPGDLQPLTRLEHLRLGEAPPCHAPVITDGLPALQTLMLRQGSSRLSAAVLRAAEVRASRPFIGRAGVSRARAGWPAARPFGGERARGAGGQGRARASRRGRAARAVPCALAAAGGRDRGDGVESGDGFSISVTARTFRRDDGRAPTGTAPLLLLTPRAHMAPASKSSRNHTLIPAHPYRTFRRIENEHTTREWTKTARSR